MNRYQFSRNLCGLACACACLALAACETSQPAASSQQPNVASTANSKSDGRLVVHRQADLGVGLVLSVDGARVAEVRVGDTYNGYLAPGRHVVTVIPAPNQLNQAAASATVSVVSGQTYSFTAARQGDMVVLVKD